MEGIQGLETRTRDENYQKSVLCFCKGLEIKYNSYVSNWDTI